MASHTPLTPPIPPPRTSSLPEDKCPTCGRALVWPLMMVRCKAGHLMCAPCSRINYSPFPSFLKPYTCLLFWCGKAIVGTAEQSNKGSGVHEGQGGVARGLSQ